MSKLVVHAKIMIDGVSDTPKKDQLISIEDGKIVSIEEYHETNEEVIHANVITPGFFNCHVHIMEPVGFGTDKKFSLMEKHSIRKNTVKTICIQELLLSVF